MAEIKQVKIGSTTYDIRDAVHSALTNNPHSVTKAQVGLGNVDNTSDANKPISTATQAALDGKANTSHGTHVTYSTTTPAAPSSTPTAGSAATVARSDHAHPLQTSVSGNAGTATKLATARTISLTGDVTGSTSFNGSANVSITATVADNSHAHTIANVTGLQSALDGKSGTSHNHDSVYIKLTARGAASGVASLDANTKIPLNQLPDVILGQLLYGGTFNASGVATISTNLRAKLGISDTTIQLINSATDDTTKSPKEYGYKTLEGAFFIAAATFTIAGTTFNTGDWLISSGAKWEKIDNTDAVTGVKGNSESSYRTGNVNITPANIGLGNVGNFKAVSTVASQGLTDTEKSNARTNIGAGTGNGSVTSVAVKMNGSTVGTVTTSGTIDLGTVITAHQDISGKADKASITAGTAGTSSATSGSTLAVPYVTMNAQGIVTGYGTHTHTVTGFAASSHTHSYAGSSSAGGAATSANKVNAAVTFSNSGSGAASGTTFDGSAAKTISYNTIGAAASSHTHSYAGSSSAGGAATSANKVNASVTFNNGGSGAASGTTFDGSTARTISYNTIGAAAASHNHDDRYYTESEADSRFVNVTGDTMTGNLTVQGTVTVGSCTLQYADEALKFVFA